MSSQESMSEEISQIARDGEEGNEEVEIIDTTYIEDTSAVDNENYAVLHWSLRGNIQKNCFKPEVEERLFKAIMTYLALKDKFSSFDFSSKIINLISHNS